MASKKLCVVCCYGLFDPKRRTALEIEGYREYLINVARHVLELPQRPDLLITGGRTTELPISEAETVEDILTKMFVTLGKGAPRMLLDNESMNAAQHVYSGVDMAEADEYDGIIVYCDKKSRFKMSVLGVQLVPKYIPWQVVSFKRKDNHPRNKYLLQWLLGLKYLFSKKFVDEQLVAE